MNWTIVISVPMVLGLFAKLFPYKAPVTNSSKNYNDLMVEYQKWELFALVPLFIILPLMTWLFGLFFYVLFGLLAGKGSDTLFEIYPDQLMWSTAGGLLACGMIVFPMEYLYRLLLKERYDEYILFTNLKHNFDGMKMLRPILWIFGLLAMACLFMLSDYYIKIYPDKILVNDFKDLTERSYEYRQVKEIHYVLFDESKHRLDPDPHYLIKFDDNTVWNTRNGLHDDKNLPEIINLLAEKSKVVVETLVVDPE